VTPAGLIRVGDLMWTLCCLRKSKRCFLCDSDLAPKMQAYRPITNGYDRMQRICLTCAERKKP